MHMTVYLWRSEDSLAEWIPSFHCVGSKNHVRVLRLGSMCLYPLCHLTGPSDLHLKLQMSSYAFPSCICLCLVSCS